MALRKRTRARVSDVAGFVFFAAFSATFFIRMPEMSLLLVPMIGKELFTAFTFLIRERPKASVGTFKARFAAYAGTFLVIGFFHAVRTWRPESFTINEVPQISALGAMLWLAGTALVGVSLWSLRYAFSIEPEARHVVRTGAYKFVRHPVYAAYVLQYLGIWLIYPSFVLAAGLAVWFGLTLTRMHFEESILAQAFPEYESYKRTTGALFPTQFAFRRQADSFCDEVGRNSQKPRRVQQHRFLHSHADTPRPQAISSDHQMLVDTAASGAGASR